MEILSPSTSARDRVEKRNLYDRHGVREYWVLDPENGELTVHQRSAGAASFDVAWSGGARERKGPGLLPDLRLEWGRILEV